MCELSKRAPSLRGFQVYVRMGPARRCPGVLFMTKTGAGAQPLWGGASAPDETKGILAYET